MNARLHWALHEWDWRPLARLTVWTAITAGTVRHAGWRVPSLGGIAREWVLAFLMTGGLMTYAQLWLLAMVTNLYFWLDERTFALAAWLTRPVVSRASFGAGFLAALSVQLSMVLGACACWRAADLGPHLVALIGEGLRVLLQVVS